MNSDCFSNASGPVQAHQALQDAAARPPGAHQQHFDLAGQQVRRDGMVRNKWLPILTRLLAPWPDVFVAVHSTWRYTHRPDELRDLLGPLGERFLGCAPRGPRAEAIRWFIHLNPHIESFLILDDAPEEFPPDLTERLVVCNPLLGSSDPPVQARIAEWLNAASQHGDAE